ncbi:MAG TPA: energy transducer TonB [Candidatus Sulfotelmatobacter sp.]|nr:energy transducer TonB [Candidatus Sulfotelmatobacter sp.]
MKSIVLASLCVLMLPFTGASYPSDQQEATKLLELAVSKTNIFDLPSFRMKASVQIDVQDKLRDGTYQMFWNGPDQWREEISFQGYSEVQLGGKGNVWIQRSTDFLPLRIYQLHEALGFGSGAAGPNPAFSLVRLGLTPKDTIKKTRSRKEHGEKLTCIEIEHETKYSSSVCISDSTGALVRDSASYSDSDFQPVDGKIFPRSLSFIEEGRKVAKVSISELVSPAEFAPNSFAPPTGVLQQEGCMNPIAPRLVNKVAPVYPTSARQQHIEGTVAVDTEIGLDGTPRMKKVVANADPSLVRSAADAITAWRYEPATCDGKPVSIETVLRVDYTLSP